MADAGPTGAKAQTGIDPANLTAAAYREQLNTKMLDMAETVPIPKGVSIIAGKDLWNQIIRTPQATGSYSARTGAPIKGP